MTKRVMIEKFMRETGADKKTAMDYLRKNNWNYGKAIGMYRLPEAFDALRQRIETMDWSALVQSVVDTVHDVAERIAEIINSDEFHNACKAVLEEAKREGEQNEDPD